MNQFLNADKYKKIKIKRFSAFLLIAAVIIIQVCFMLCCYKNYEDKADILDYMAAEDYDSGLDLAVRLMKEDKKHPAQMLEQYGYRYSLQNRFYADFLKQCMASAAISGLALTVFLAGRYLREKYERKVLAEYLNSLNQRLSGFWNRSDSQEGFIETEKVSDKHAEKASDNHTEKVSDNHTEKASDKHTQMKFPVLEGFEEDTGRLNEQLERFEEYLSFAREQSFMEKEKTKKLVTDLSHQLKTPVAALDTCFTILEDTELAKEERTEFYQRCRNELDGLKTLLESMIQISNMESGLIQIKLKKALLMDTVVLAVNRIYPKASEKQTELVFECEPQMDQAEIMHDTKWLCEALINVLDNAVKYSPCGSEIFVRIQKGISFAKIEIQDQGIGIDKKDFHKVFQRFYRGRSPWVQQAEGAGVGLYLAQKIIAEHHGMLSVKAGNGREQGFPGSIFVIRLPYL